MTLELRALPAEQLPAWLRRTHDEYIRSRIAAGESAEEARENADRSEERAFPGGVLAHGHQVFEVIEGAEIVGQLWIGPRTTGGDDWWVYDIEISEEHRGRGFGRATMEAAESEARARGARTLGLNVFGFNTIARGLYESLGYETSAIQMRKPLVAPPA
jgi:ribosomal protein S18 acetylase RimI-like enzyme